MGSPPRKIRVDQSAHSADVRRQLGGALRRRLSQLGMSQADLGKLVGVSQSQVSEWIRGGSALTVAQMLHVDAALGWAPGGLLMEAGWISALHLPSVIANDKHLDDAGKEAVIAAYDRAVRDSATRSAWGDDVSSRHLTDALNMGLNHLDVVLPREGGFVVEALDVLKQAAGDRGEMDDNQWANHLGQVAREPKVQEAMRKAADDALEGEIDKAMLPMRQLLERAAEPMRELVRQALENARDDLREYVGIERRLPPSPDWPGPSVADDEGEG